jgi:hypothetical protein
MQGVRKNGFAKADVAFNLGFVKPSLFLAQLRISSRPFWRTLAVETGMHCAAGGVVCLRFDLEL